MLRVKNGIVAGTCLACLLLGGMGWAARAPAPFPRPGRLPPELLAALNRHVLRVNGVLFAQVDLDVRADGQAIGLSGTFACDGTGKTRLVCKVLGQVWLDCGSNETEHWWKVGREKLIRLRHRPRAGQKDEKAVRGLPFDPGMMPALLGLLPYAPSATCRLGRRGERLEVVETFAGLDGKPVRKIIVVEPGGGDFRVVGHRLEDAGGRLLLSCFLGERRRDRGSGQVVPSRLVLRWPAGKVEIHVRLTPLERNAVRGPAPRLFVPPADR
jgi:hypothetical protein